MKIISKTTFYTYETPLRGLALVFEDLLRRQARRTNFSPYCPAYAYHL